jgi:ferric iron reductase protein FhuF
MQYQGPLFPLMNGHPSATYATRDTALEVGVLVSSYCCSSYRIGGLGHPLLHMQLETQLWRVLVSSYCCYSYRVADPKQTINTSLTLIHFMTIALSLTKNVVLPK